MSLYINTSKCTQILPLSRMSVNNLSIAPNEVFDSRVTCLNVDAFKEFTPFTMGRDIEMLSVVRTYALGDIIQLVPVVRQLKEKHNIKNINFVTSPRFTNNFSKVFPEFLHINRKMGVTVNLDGIFERDHSLSNTDRYLHRVLIGAKYLELDFDVSKIDWSAGYMTTPFNRFVEGDNVIAVQIKGSGPIKTLPIDFVKQMVKEIVAHGYSVLLLDHDKNVGFDGDGIINACGKMSIIDVIENLKLCKCCLTMDSGILWLAHVANCPVITFLGSTREEERISLHPQYPHKAKAINLATHVGCSPCFETKVRCKGSIDCMNKFNCGIILNEVIKNLENIVKGGRNG